MKTSSSAAFDWTSEEYSNFGVKPQVTSHSYHELPLFSDEGLVKLLDAHPRENLQAHTMGLDPLNYKDWQQVNINEHTTGEQMLEAVKKGRVWINLTQIQKHSPEFGEIITDMYDRLDQKCEHLNDPKGTHCALLISSPGAQVYYHVDADPNMIWHMRGQKNIWMYPPMNFDIMPQEFLEDIYASEIDEDVPYKAEFDDLAEHALLNPGDAASWPHNAPHRIVNVDMNVSLATSYYTSDIYQREYVHLANRFILRNLGIKNRGVAETGLVAAAKRMSYRILNRLRPFSRRSRSANYLTDLELDPTTPLGWRKLPEPVLPAFAKAA